MQQLAAAPRRPKAAVRYSVDLPKDQHRFLRVFAIDAGASARDVVRALLTLLEHDETLAARVRQSLPG